MVDSALLAALFGAVALNAVVAVVAIRRRGEEPGATALATFAAALMVGTLTVIMEVTATTVTTKVLWFGTGLVAQAVVVGAWFYFALAYTGQDRWTGVRTAAGLAVVPVLTAVVFAVPSLRPLAIEPPATITVGTSLRTTGATASLGPMLIVQGLYAFVVALAATVVFVQFFVRSRRLNPSQSVAILFAALLPWAAVLFQAFVKVVPIDISLFAWPVSGLIMAVALSRVRLLDPVSAGRKTVVEEMSDGVILVDREDRVSDINPAARELLDIETDVTGQSADRVVPEWERVREVDDWLEIAVDGADHTRYLETETSPFFDQHDRLAGRLVVFRNVTARKRREQSLARFKTVFESVQDRVFVLDGAGRFVLVNDPFAEFVGHDAADLEGRTFDGLVAEGAVPTSPDSKLGPREVTVVTADREVPCEVLLAPVALEGDEGAVGVVRDITERKRVERSLRETTARFETLVEASPLAIVAADRDGVVEVWNPAAEELFGWSADSVVGEELPIIPEEREEEVERSHQRVLAGERITGLEIPLERADGSRVQTSVSVAPIYDDAGEVQGSVSVIADITERVERERKLRRQNERLDEFASIVSHDLRNPLQVAQGYVDHAVETGEIDRLDRATEALERMEGLIENVLTLARKGQDIEDPEPVAFETVVSLAWGRMPTDSAGIEVVDPPETILSDDTRLAELLENLFRNAVEHAGAEVTVTVGGLDDGFYVADDGPGIPEDEREDVFESGYSTDSGGTGLGLAIVRRIAEAHGWDVTLTASEAGGARFEFTGVEVVDAPTDSA